MTPEQLVQAQRDYFFSGQTLCADFRINAIRNLKKAILLHEKEIIDALHTDLGKSSYEAYMCELGLVLQNISYALSHIKQWMKPKYEYTSLTHFPARSMILEEPFGVVLIMSPWNYPLLLSIEPLVGAIATGNCVLLKPSEYSPAMNEVLIHIINETFDNKHVALIQGGIGETQNLLEQRFDYIFFTGSVNVGKIVMEKASRHLTPVTLELGGKSPVIIDKTANLPLTAKRIIFGKCLNCGQTCVAPDYVLVEASVHDEFVQCLKQQLQTMYGNALQNKDYGKIINKKHFDRLCHLIDPTKIIYGGQASIPTLQLEPTILDNVSATDAIMQEEVFGPILPILTVKNIDEAICFVQQHEKPLALYLFTNNKTVERNVLQKLSFGGGCINDTIMHVGNANLPFGGVGNSGMGHYHGKYTFSTFSHQKSIIKKSTLFDTSFRYPPYSYLKNKIIRFFLK